MSESDENRESCLQKADPKDDIEPWSIKVHADFLSKNIYLITGRQIFRPVNLHIVNTHMIILIPMKSNQWWSCHTPAKGRANVTIEEGFQSICLPRRHLT